MVTSACRPPPMKSAMAVLAQVAAERLGVNLGSVRVEVGDSRFPPTPVAGGSNTTASTCSAVLKTCDAIRSKLFNAAVAAKEGPLAGRSANALTLNDGKVIAADGAGEKIEHVFK